MRSVLCSLLIILVLAFPLAWAEDAKTPSLPAPAADANSTQLPSLTSEEKDRLLAPITLRASLQKTQNLPLTLKQALQLAEGKDINIAIAEETAHQEKLNYELSLSDLLPDLTATYNQSRFVGGTQNFQGENLSVFRTTIQPQLTANYIVYTGGRNIFLIKANKKRAEAQKNLAEDVRQDILRQVGVAYYDLQQAYWQRAIALQAIKEAQDQVALNQGRYDAGLGLKLDLLQAQTNLSTQQQALTDAETLVSQSSNRLAQLLNLDFEVNIKPQTLESTEAHLVPQDLTTPEMLAIAKEQNPRLRGYMELVKAGKNDVRVAIADFFPQVNITSYLNYTGQRFEQLNQGKFIGVQASWNLLENMGFARSIALKQARSNERLASLNLAQTDRLLEESLANAVVTIKALEAKITQAKDTLTFAKATYAQAWGRLKGGVGTNIDLQAAMTQLTQARSNLANNFLAYNAAQITLLTSLGVASVETFTEGYTPSAKPATTPVPSPTPTP